MKQNHSIKKQILDITFDSEREAFTFRDTLGEIFTTDIIPIIETYLNRLSVGDETYRIDRLEIDLGELNRDNFRYDFKKKMEKEFPQSLVEYFSTRDVPAQPDYTEGMSSGNKVDKDVKDFEVLEYFIMNGMLPWWVKRYEVYDITALLEMEIQAHPHGMKKLLDRSVNKPAALKRLILNTTEGTFKKMIGIFYKGDTARLCHITDDLMEILKESGISGLSDNAALDRDVRTAVLHFCITSAGHEAPDNDRVIHQVLKHITGIGSYNFAAVYRVVVDAMTKKGYKPGLTKELLAEYKKDIPGRSGDRKKHDVGKSSFLPDFTREEIADYGDTLADIVPVLKRFQRYIPIDARHGDTIDRYIAEHKTSVQKEDEKPDTRNGGRLHNGELHATRLTDIQKSLKELLPKAVDTLERMYEVIRDIVKKAGNDRDDNEAVKKLWDAFVEKGKHGEELINALYTQIMRYINEETDKQKQNEAQAVKRSLELLNDKVNNAGMQDTAVSQNTFTVSNEIYVANAGIVLLWPYITHFFELLGLCANKEFIDTAKQERAVCILQYLVTGTDDIFEYDVMLNKVLCGIDLESMVETNITLTDREKEECDKLLRAVVHNWPVLKNMSIQALREMFLKREGVISVRDGNQLLRVEEKSQDILIDRMPWGIGTIKLPWMDRLLFVEWRM